MDPPASYGAGASNRPPARSFSPRRPSRRPWSDSHHANRGAPGPRTTTPYARDHPPRGRFNPYRRGGSVAMVDRPQAALADRALPRRRHPPSPPPLPPLPSSAQGRSLHSTTSTGQGHTPSRTSSHHDSLGSFARHYPSSVTSSGNHHHSHHHRVDSYTPHRPLSPRSTDRPHRSYNRSHTASNGSIDRYIPSTAHPLSPKRRGPLSSTSSPSHPSANGGNSTASSYRPSARHRLGTDRESDRWRPPSRQRPGFSPSSRTRDPLGSPRRDLASHSEKPRLGTTTTADEVTVHKSVDSRTNKDSWLPASPEPLSYPSNKTSLSVSAEHTPLLRKPRPALATATNGSSPDGGPKSRVSLSNNLPDFSLPPLSLAKPSSAYTSSLSPLSGRSPSPNRQSHGPPKLASVVPTAECQPTSLPPSIPHISEAQSKRKLSLSTTDRAYLESPRLDKRLCSPRPVSPQLAPASSPKAVARSPPWPAVSREPTISPKPPVALAPGLAWTSPPSKTVKVPVTLSQLPSPTAPVSEPALPLVSREPIPIALPGASLPGPTTPLSIPPPEADINSSVSPVLSPPRGLSPSVNSVEHPPQPSTPSATASPKASAMQVDILSPPADNDGLFVPPFDSDLPWHRVYRDNQLRAKRAHAVDLFGVDPYIPPVPALRQVTDYPFYRTNLTSHALVGPKIARVIAQERQQTHHHEAALKRQYKFWYKKWQAQLVQPPLESSRASPAVSDTSSRRDDLGLRTTPTSTRPSRRHGSGSAGLYSSDTVRSEAELMEIIQSLQHEQMHNPDFRSSRTAAIIPNMELDPRKRLLLMYNNCNGLVINPKVYYEIGQPLYNTSCGSWSLAESDIFIRRYFQYPKRFEKMASAIAEKSATQCVLFYYRTKKHYRYKFLITSQGRSELRQARRMGLGLSQAAFVVGAISSQGKRIRSYLTREILEQELQRLNEMLGDFTTDPRQVCAKAKLANLPTPTVTTNESSQSGRQPIRRTRSKSSNAASRATTPVLRNRVTDNAMDTDGSPPSVAGELPSDADGAIGKPLASPIPVCTCNASPGHQPGCPMRARGRQRKSVSSPHERPAQPLVLAPVALRRRSSSRNSSANSEQLSRLSSKSPAQLEPIAEHTLAATPSLDKPSEDSGLPSSDLGRRIDDGDGEDLVRIRRLSTSTVGELGSSTSPPPPTPATIARWSDLDRILAVEGYRLYGRDFEAVSRMVRTKTEDQCRNYYHNYRRKYGPEAFKNPPEWFTKEKLTEAQTYVATLYNSPQSITPTKSLSHPTFADTDTPEPPTTIITNVKAEAPEEATPMPMTTEFSSDPGRGSETSMLAISNLTLQETTPASVPPPPTGAPRGPDASGPTPLAVSTSTPMESQSLSTTNEPSSAKPMSITPAQDTKCPATDPAIPAPVVTPPVRKPHYSSYWSVAEKSYFLTYLAQVGKQWDKIAGLLKTKTAIQVRNYFNNNQERLRLDRIVEEWANRQTQPPGQLGPTASDVQLVSMAPSAPAPELNVQPVLSSIPPSSGQRTTAEVPPSSAIRSTSISNLLTCDETPATSHTNAHEPAPPMAHAIRLATTQVPAQPCPPVAPKVTKIDALLNSNMEADDPEEWKKQTMMDWFTAEPADKTDPVTVTLSSAEPHTTLGATRALHGNKPIAKPLPHVSRDASVANQPNPIPYPTACHTPSLPPTSQATALSAFSPAQRSPRASPYPVHRRPSASSASSLGAPENRPAGPAMPYHARPRSPAYPPSSLSIGSPSGSVHGSPHLGYQAAPGPGPPHTPYAPPPAGHDYTIRPPPSANRTYPPMGQFTPPPTTPAIPMGSFSPPQEAHHMARPPLGPGAPAYPHTSSPATPGQAQFPASSPGFPPYAAHHGVRRDSSGMTIPLAPGSVGGLPQHHPHAPHHHTYSLGLHRPPPGAPAVGASTPRPPSTPTSLVSAGGVPGSYPGYGYPPYPGGGTAPPPHPHLYPQDPHGRASYPPEYGGTGSGGEYRSGPASEAVPPSPHYPPPPAAYRGLPPPTAANHAPYPHQQSQQPAPGATMARYEYNGAYGSGGGYPPPNSYSPRPPGSGYPGH